MSAPTDLTDRIEGSTQHEEAEEEARLADEEEEQNEGWTDYEGEFVETLRELLWEQYNDAEDPWPLVEVEDIASFAEIGYLTYDKGLRLRLADGSQFDLTVTCIEEPEARLTAEEEGDA